MPHPPLLGVTLQSQLRLAFAGIRTRRVLGVVKDQHISGGGLGGNDEGTLRHVASSAGRIEEEAEGRAFHWSDASPLTYVH